jgi:nitroreductase
LNGEAMTQVSKNAPERLQAFDRLLQDRHSCRGFLPQSVPRDLIERILTTSQRTASWSNTQPWFVHIASGPVLQAIVQDLVEKVNLNAKPKPELEWPREIRGVHLARKRDCGWSLYHAVGIQKGDREASARFAKDNFRLFGAPHLAVVCSDEALGVHGVMDCGAWVTNFLLAAEAAGVAALAQAALASWPDVLRRYLPIDPEHRIICGISFGYEDKSRPANTFRTSRASIAEVVIWSGE